MRILIVEDDRKISSFLFKALKQAGFAVDHAENGKSGLHLALTVPYDVAVIDIMLPELDGLALLEELRRHKVTTPVIILSAKRSVDDPAILILANSSGFWLRGSRLEAVQHERH
jgi:two-component system OmpR family response regulator